MLLKMKETKQRYFQVKERWKGLAGGTIVLLYEEEESEIWKCSKFSSKTIIHGPSPAEKQPQKRPCSKIAIAIGENLRNQGMFLP